LTGRSRSNLTGNAHDNQLAGNRADNVIDGGDGNDTVLYPRPESEYQVTRHADGRITVIGDGEDTLVNLEKVVFGTPFIDPTALTAPVPPGIDD